MNRSKQSSNAFWDGAFHKATQQPHAGDQAHPVLQVQVATIAVADLVGMYVSEAVLYHASLLMKTTFFEQSKASKKNAYQTNPNN
jgi:hypothetical protein